MFSDHPDVAWMCGACDKFPDRQWMNRLLTRAVEYPVLGSVLRRKVYPMECYDFWDHHCKGFSTPCRDLLRTDLTEKSKGQVQSAMAKLVSGRKPRLLLKITGWPRLGFLSEIFEDAKFIHVLRDGRAVANSLIQMEWWWGWRGPDNWRWGSLSPAQREEWQKYNQSFIVLAALQWKILMDAAERAKEHVKGADLLEIKYEQLCSDSIGVFKEVAQFSEVEWTSGFEKKLRKYELRNTNSKWERELNATQRTEMNEVLGDYLKRYDYV
jgi:hypothetical protein